MADNRGPLLVTADYRVDAKNRAAFLGAIDELGHARKRDGAYAWGNYEAVSDSGRFIESFMIESWLEFMHVRERVTNADKMVEDQIHQLLAEAPRATVFVSSERPHRTWRRGKGDSGLDRVDKDQR